LKYPRNYGKNPEIYSTDFILYTLKENPISDANVPVKRSLIAASPEAVFTDGKFLICDPGFQETTFQNHDFHLLSTK
jgi:hypothetical protein